MPFDWMYTTPAAGRAQQDAQGREAALSEEIRQRAGLFRRLGYVRAHAIHRCLGNIAWAYSEAGTPPLSAADVRQIVAEVYDR